MAAQRMITQRDIVTSPQYVVEGKTAATYGVTPGSPTYVQALADAILIEASSHTTVESRDSGDVDRKKSELVRRGRMVRLVGKLQAADETLLEWLMNKPDETDGSPDESRTFVQGYKATSGNTNYETYKGCKPMTCTLTLGADFVTVDATLSYHDKTVNTTAVTTLDSSITYVPLLQEDAPDNPFQWDGDNYERRSASVTVAFDEALQDSQGDDEIVYRQPTKRNVSGSFEIFKKNNDMHSDAEDHTARAMVIKVTSAITLTFAGAVIDPSGEDVRGDTSDATIESHSFTANSLTIS